MGHGHAILLTSGDHYSPAQAATYSNRNRFRASHDQHWKMAPKPGVPQPRTNSQLRHRRRDPPSPQPHRPGPRHRSCKSEPFFAVMVGRKSNRGPHTGAIPQHSMPEGPAAIPHALQHNPDPFRSFRTTPIRPRHCHRLARPKLFPSHRRAHRNNANAMEK